MPQLAQIGRKRLIEIEFKEWSWKEPGPPTMGLIAQSVSVYTESLTVETKGEGGGREGGREKGRGRYHYYCYCC